MNELTPFANPIAKPETFFGACPHDCPDTCAMLFDVRDGKLAKSVKFGDTKSFSLQLNDVNNNPMPADTRVEVTGIVNASTGTVSPATVPSCFAPGAAAASTACCTRVAIGPSGA